jgi:predicted nucleic acid-binding protein
MIFVDTSAFLAILNRSDEFHTEAAPHWVDYVKAGEHLFTSNYVVSETCALAQNRIGMQAVRRLFEEMLPVVVLHWIDRSVHETGVAMLLAANRRQLSLVDCTSFAVMREIGIASAFTFDDHFAEQGFTIVPAQEN